MAEITAPPQEKLITGEELYERVGVGPCELIDGRIVPMSPTGGKHGGVEFNFAQAIHAFAHPRNLGKVQVGEVGIFTRRNPDRVRAADVLFLSNERYAQWNQTRGYLNVAPELIVEVLSPDDAMLDLTQKLREYFAIGVKLVWVADPDEQVVYAYRSLTDVREYKASDSLSGDEVLPGFEVPVLSLFEA